MKARSHVLHFSFLALILSGIFFLAPSSWSDHLVGEPQLEKLPIWASCCREHDCVAEDVKMMGKAGNEMISVEIDGVQTVVGKQKFTPVPSSHTWVCYRDSTGSVNDDNIRCILYPQRDGTAKAPRKGLPVTRRWLP
jgi:hypothetical protein